MISRYFLGVTQDKYGPDDTFYVEPQATRSSKPDSVRAEIEAKRVKQQEKQYRFAFGGFTSSVAVIDQNGNMLYQEDTHGDPLRAPGLAVNFVNFLHTLPHAPFEWVEGPDSHECRVRWFGFDIREVLHQIALEAMRAAPALQVPLPMWYHRHFEPLPFIDPYEALVPSSLREDVDVYCLHEYLFGEVLSAAHVSTAHLRANFVRQLVMRTQPRFFILD